MIQLERACHDSPWGETAFVDCLRSRYECWVMEGDSAVEAARSIYGYVIASDVLNEGHLLNIVVCESHQGQGYGVQLLEFIEVLLQKKGIQSLFLEVRQSNQVAQNLYLKRGFQQIGIRKDYYKMVDGQRESALIMQCILSSSCVESDQ